MIAAIGNTLLLGLGIALNPLAIVITILIANREHARRNGTALTIGYFTFLYRFFSGKVGLEKDNY